MVEDIFGISPKTLFGIIALFLGNFMFFYGGLLPILAGTVLVVFGIYLIYLEVRAAFKDINKEQKK